MGYKVSRHAVTFCSYGNKNPLAASLVRPWYNTRTSIKCLNALEIMVIVTYLYE